MCHVGTQVSWTLLGLAEVAAATTEDAARAAISNVQCLQHDIDCTCLSFWLIKSARSTCPSSCTAGVRHTMLSYTQALSIAFLSWASYIACQAPAPSTDLPQRASSDAPIEAAFSPYQLPRAAEASCELRLLSALGWHQAYNPSGYSITTETPANLTVDSWQSLGCLQSLTNLTLTGSMPDLPDAWGANSSFPRLQSLTLATSGLAGSLPVSWHQSTAFPSLKFLNLSFTQLSGTLPASWAQAGAFPALEGLDLSATSIQGTLPVEWGHTGAFAHLGLLGLVGTQLSGTLPSSWAGNNSLPSLIVLELGLSNLTGTLPAEWGSPSAFQRLKALSVINCSISELGCLRNVSVVDDTSVPGVGGSLPHSWAGAGAFPSISNLVLYGMPLSGSIPPSWGGDMAFPSLLSLQLGLNDISGTLPVEWGSAAAFQRLQQLSIFDTNISGTLPDTWADTGAFPALLSLSIWDTPLKGTLPLPWARPAALPQLISLELGGCNVEGTLPAEWATPAAFQRLSYLHLTACSITGSLPESWAQPNAFPALSSLDLSGLPLLKGSLPTSWGSLPSLIDLELGGSSALTGTLPAEWGSPNSFQQLQSLRIHDTAISAAVPASWGSNTAFPQLVELSLINNWPLSGHQTAQESILLASSDLTTQQRQSLYPQDQLSNDSASQHAGAWPRLEALILYNTSLRGSIPTSWSTSGAFPLLQTLVISQNLLTGALPSTLPSQLQVLAASDNQLSSSIPDGWASPTSAPGLQQLYLYNNHLTGTLPPTWPSQLQLLQINGNYFAGTLPGDLGQLQQLRAIALGNNALTGQLPAAWAAPGAFPRLLYLDCNRLNITGPLPSAWGSPTAFPALENLFLYGTNISGPLPDSWAAAAGAFPHLKELQLSATQASGSIPASWTSAGGFPWLQALHAASTQLSGPIPAFHNTKLSVIEMDNSHFGADLSAFWNSTAPLLAASLSGNAISGFLPDRPTTLYQLTFLNLAGNPLQGTVPLSWLHPGEFLSHITFLNVGSMWGRSLSLNSWRQTLCLEKDLYNADVTGQQLKQIPGLVGSLAMHELDPNNANFTDWTAWVQNNADVTADVVLQLLRLYHNQLAAVQVLCANSSSLKAVIALWLTFVACCVIIVGAYLLLRHRSGSQPVWSAQVRQSACFVRVSGLVHAIYKALYGLGGLAFYYYDLTTSIMVLVEVWGVWPAAVLLTILLVHFAATSGIVTFQALARMTYFSNNSVCSSWVRLFLAVLLSPFLIPIVLLLDTVAFVHEITECLELFLGVHNWSCLQTVYSCAYKLQGGVQALGGIGLGWVDLTSYERMHNTVAAVLQSFPTVLLNSVLFSLGNKPSHGVFLSTGLFVSAITASYLAMLKCLVVVLWHAQKEGINPAAYAVSLLAGNTLGGKSTMPEEVGQSPEVRVQEVQMMTPQYSEASLPPPDSTDISIRQSDDYSCLHLTPQNSSSALLPLHSIDSLVRQSEEYNSRK